MRVYACGFLLVVFDFVVVGIYFIVYYLVWVWCLGVVLL